MLQSDISVEVQSFAVEDYTTWSDFKDSNYLSVLQPFYFKDLYLFVCTKGRARFNINMRDYDIEENSVGIVLPGTIVLISEISPDIEFYSLLINMNYMTDIPLAKDLLSIRKDSTSPPESFYSKSNKEDILRIVKYYDLLKMLSKKRNESFSDKISKGIIFSLLYEYVSIQNSSKDIITRKNTSRQDELTNQFFNLLRLHGTKERNVGFYADKMCLTPKYLSSLIKQTTTKSAFSWINSTSITMAKILLKTQDYSISQIAEELNFPNPSFFSRFFKKHTSISPNEFRKN